MFLENKEHTAIRHLSWEIDTKGALRLNYDCKESMASKGKKTITRD